MSYEYSLDRGSPYDLNTYSGRVHHFMRMIHPKNMLYSTKEISKAQNLLKEFEEGKIDAKTNSDALWNAKYAVISNVHPDTGKEIFPLFRMSAFVPVNIPTVIGLNLLPATPFNIVFFQTLNQSYNFGVNLCNANQTNSTNQTRDIVGRYALAVSASLIVSLGSVALLKRTSLGKRNEVFSRFGNYLGGATAGALNLVVTRYVDATQGLSLKDEVTRESIEGKRSKKAGSISMMQGAFSRSVIGLPIFILPNLIQQSFKYMNLLPSGRIGMTIFNSTIAALALWIALPLSIGTFPQEGRIHYSKLEQEFHDLKNSKGQKIEYFVFNRGL